MYIITMKSNTPTHSAFFLSSADSKEEAAATIEAKISWLEGSTAATPHGFCRIDRQEIGGDLFVDCYTPYSLPARFSFHAQKASELKGNDFGALVYE